MIRPVILYGDPILELVSTEVKLETLSDLNLLISDMFETMLKANGIGLAAVQVGVPLRLFIVEAHIPEENFHLRGVFINPKILKEWGELVKHPEGCLSIPQITALVERPAEIEMEWFNEEGKYSKENFSGFAARILQHEYEHLDGNIYVDRLDKMWQELLAIPLDLIKNRKLEVAYLYK